MGDLHVELYGERIGSISGDWRTFDFAADPDAVSRWGLDSPILSTGVPLQTRPNRARKPRRQAFFAELLPEGDMLTQLAEEAGVGIFDVVALLRHYGRDVAGALQIWDPTAPGEPRTPHTEERTDSGVAELLREVRRNPIGNSTPTGKSSLAGVQDKIVLALVDGTWHRALDGYPSTHILKPAPIDQPQLIFDEEYGARIARGIGLAAFETRTETFDGTRALVIERYDRAPNAPQRRIHQEDFSQALGARGNQKYQKIGGVVSLERIARVLREYTAESSLHGLLRMVTLSAAVGNLDMHAKNISLLHPHDDEPRLAPMYDVVPQAHHQGMDGELALAVNRVYAHRDLTREDIVVEALMWGIRDPRPIIDSTLEQVRELARIETPQPESHPGLQADIVRFTTRLLDGRAAGDGK